MLSNNPRSKSVTERITHAASIATLGLSSIVGCGASMPTAQTVQARSHQQLVNAFGKGADAIADSVQPSLELLDPACQLQATTIDVTERPGSDYPLSATVNIAQDCPGDVSLVNSFETAHPVFAISKQGKPYLSTRLEEGPYVFRTTAFSFQPILKANAPLSVSFPFSAEIPQRALNSTDRRAVEAEELKLNAHCTVPEIRTWISYTPEGEVSSAHVLKSGVICPTVPIPLDYWYDCPSPEFAKTPKHPLIITGCAVEPTTKIKESNYQPPAF